MALVTALSFMWGFVILSGAPHMADRAAGAASVRMPYLGFAAVLFLLALVMWRAKLPVLASIEGAGAGYARNGQVVTSAWRMPHLLLGAVDIFTYCGAEVCIGSFRVNYFAQPEIGGLAERAGARYVSYYWLGALADRIGVQASVALPAVCYVYVVYCGLRGHRQ
jgi:FHS family L-fucose permease-like MFS transporter